MAVVTALSFLSVLRSQVPTFVIAIEESLDKSYNLNVSEYEADHVCWRTETMEEYSSLRDDLVDSPENYKLLVESEVGGRPIATFALMSGISVGKRCISVIEIPAPKPGSAYSRGLEHVEFVIRGSSAASSPVNSEIHQSAFDAFLRQYPTMPWDTKAKTKSINPDVSLKLELKDFGKCSVKFHLFSLEKVIEYENDAGISKI